MTPAIAAKKKKTPKVPKKVLEARVEIDSISTSEVTSYCPLCSARVFSIGVGKAGTTLINRKCECGATVRVIALSEIEKPLEEPTPEPSFEDHSVPTFLEEPEEDRAPWYAVLLGYLVLCVISVILFLGGLDVYLRYEAHHHPSSSRLMVSPPDSAIAMLADPGPNGSVAVSKPDGSIAWETQPPFSLHIDITRNCWIDVSDGDKHIFAGTVTGDFSRTFDDLNSATVRTGCPGAAAFWINGDGYSPVNEAENPTKVGLYHFGNQSSTN